MSHEATMAPSARKVFDSLPAATQVHVATAVQKLGSDPRPAKATEVPGKPGTWRLPVDDVHLVYAVDDGKRTVVVQAIRKSTS